MSPLASLRCLFYLYATKRLIRFDESAHAADSANDPASALSKNEQLERLHHLLTTLPFEFQQVLELQELKDMAYRQIAKVTGVPIGTVMLRPARGRLRLRQ